MILKWGDCSLYEPLHGAKHLLRGGTALLLALLLCGAVGAGAADMTDTRMLVPVGHTVGIKLFSRGVLVVKLSEGGTPAKASGLQTGDVIVKCAGNPVTSTEQFQDLLQESGGKATDLQVKRDGGSMTISVEPEANDEGVYCIGAWIRDSMAGIGTVTYYDPANQSFGALGHGITDVDTAQLMPFSNGSILSSTVKAVKKGESGAAGELRGDFDLTGDLGSLYANTNSGVFGTLNDDSIAQGLEPVPVAAASEVTVGPAVIRSNVAGEAVEEYTVEITKLFDAGDEDTRDMMITVTDPRLLEGTGGIVQGMSGSPILQNGKIVGAVTHVLVNDPTRGYGIYIENMLDAAG